MSKRAKTREKSDSIMHRDIKDLHILRSLKRLANTRVTEWEIRDLPNLRVTEWELTDIANYRVTEWELKDLLGKRERREREARPSPATMENLSNSLVGFIRFVSKNLIDDPDLAEIKVASTTPGALTIELVLTRRDTAAIIGHGGHTATAIRNIVKDIAHQQLARVRISILSHEDYALKPD